MNRSQIISHRGWHCNNHASMNTQTSLEAALDNGFGIETDLRDHNQRVVISHDPPRSDSALLDAEWLFKYIAQIRPKGRLALNIKSDGLAHAIKELLQSNKLDDESIYFFDMAVPDALQYIANGLQTYSRVSEYEESPPYSNELSGVWIDSFTGKFPQVHYAEKLIGAGCRVTIVSPELHGRPYRELWTELKESDLHNSSLLDLCTDFPDKAAEFFVDA